MKVGSILMTKNGRLRGNGIIIGKKTDEKLGVIWECLSDFGNTFSLTAQELKTHYYIKVKSPKNVLKWNTERDIKRFEYKLNEKEQ